MQIFVGNARNLSLIEIAGELAACVEVIILTSEPEYSRDESGIVKQHKISEFRFQAGADQLCELAEHLLAMARDARELENRVEVKSATD